MTLDEFEEIVTQACLGSPAVASLSVSGSGLTWLRLRAYLVDESLIEAFFNQATGRTAFAWIQNDRRVFGADNTGGWHWHPLDAPDSHVSSDLAITFDAFLDRVEEQITSF